MPVEESIEKNGVRNCIKGCTQVKEDEDEMFTVSKPEAAAVMRSLVSLKRTFSVSWRWRKPDWNCSKRLYWVKWEWS